MLFTLDDLALEKKLSFVKCSASITRSFLNLGYGHIAPKTAWGKIVTIFYAILGIPLMLMCLSNIGDIMATSFRFLYWRVCCYVCTKETKKRRSRSRDSRFSRSRNPSFRRSMRTSTRSADSGFGLSEISPPVSHSDSDLRYHDDWTSSKRGASLPRMRSSQMSRYSEPVRGHSLDRRKLQEVELDPELLGKAAILCNKYVVGGNGALRDTPRQQVQHRRNFLEIPRQPSPASSDSDVRRHRRKRSPNPSPKMMTPLGYGHRSKYLDDPESDEEYYYDDYYETTRTRIRPVPIWLCVFLVVSYIIAGAFLFNSWEKWDVLKAAYFCFITLTTIGFGDLVPAKGVSEDPYRATISIALCSLYLLFGIALLAMSFNLVQEEVISNIRSIAKTLGIIKKDEDSEDED